MTTWHAACASSASCVEVANDGNGTRVRDSKDPDGPVLAFTQAERAAHIAAVKAGELDWTLDTDGVQS